MEFFPIKPSLIALLKSHSNTDACCFPFSFFLCLALFFHSYNGFSQSKTFTNPIRDGADPWVFQKDGLYFYCSTTGNGIAVCRSTKLTEQGKMVKVWESPMEGWNHANIWAPELHFIDGHWYIYYTAGNCREVHLSISVRVC